MDKHKIIILSLFFVSVCNIGIAQSVEKVKVLNSIEITANPDKVWTAISNLCNLDKLVPEIIEQTEMVGNGEGSIVTLTLKSNGAKVVEKITNLDNKKRVLSYEMIETPMPLSYYKATISMVTLDYDKYNISFDSVFKATEGNNEMMTNTIDNFQKTFLTNVKKIYNEK
ncbi:SRPBCC family protein [Flagellimonas lutimaris]|uniref:SRPBCC family protein n=1 Tax=Flagellimonas lutimaris TaxID=475082 RepID=UPI003F5CE38D